MNLTDLNRQDVRVISEETRFDGFLSVTEYQFSYPALSHAGTITSQLEVVQRRDAVAVLLCHADTQQFVLVEQFRGGAFAANLDPWLMEIVAGLIDEGESPIDAVKREASEEAGVEISELIPIQAYLPTPGAFSEVIHLFMGFISELPTQSAGGMIEESEDIKIHTVSIQETLAQLKQGKFISGPMLMALMWYQNHYA